MVKYQEDVLDRTFAALSDPTRRALLARLGDRESLSVSELAQPFSMSLPAIMKHLDVLSDAGLIARDPLAPRLEPAARQRLSFLQQDRDQTLDQALLRLVLADPVVATVLPAVRDPGHLAELAAAADLPPPTPEDLDRLAELHEERFGLGEEEGRGDPAGAPDPEGRR